MLLLRICNVIKKSSSSSQKKKKNWEAFDRAVIPDASFLKAVVCRCSTK